MGNEHIAIRVRDLVKEYRIYARPADMLTELISAKQRHTRFRALDRVSFEVRHGEVVGVIGRNGAGKSTLLKVLTGVVDHDEGQVEVNGRVSAILELGMGINPEYSGRENIVYGGLCRGMSKQAVLAKLDHIIDFAELREVIDRPFKTYSSGMQARLLFSTAIAVDADILIIDEALAAGDALFQEKCFSLIKELVAAGRTIFFVSHSIALIQQLCTRGLLLHEGRLVIDGETSLVLHEYDELLARARNRSTIAAPVYVMGDGIEHRPDLKACVTNLEILDEDGRPTTLLEGGRRYAVREVVALNEHIEHAIVGFRIHLPSGLVLYSLQNTLLQLDLSGDAGDVIEACFEFECRLQAGQYLLSGGVGEVLDASAGLYPAPFHEIHIRNNAKVLHVLSDNVHGGLFDFGAEVRFRTLARRADLARPASRGSVIEPSARDVPCSS